MRLILAIFVAGLILATGCQHQATPYSPELSQRDQQELLEANSHRLAGEDAPRQYSAMDTAVRPFKEVFVDIPVRIYDKYTGDTPGTAVRKLEDETNADNRRGGIFRLVDDKGGRTPLYQLLYSEIAAKEANPLVKAAALRACNRARSHTPKDLEICLQSLENTNSLVRLEAAKWLANVPYPESIPQLIKHFTDDPNIDVRIACADALRSFKTLEVSRALVAALGNQDFAVAWQSRQSLTLLTGHDYRYDQGQWLEYFSTRAQPFL